MKTIQVYYPLVYCDTSSFEIEKIKKKLYEIVEEYKKKFKQSQEVKGSRSSYLGPLLPKRGSYADKFDIRVFVAKNTSYFDILCSWKTNGIKYSILHDIAKNVLAIPVTTIASESTFSTSGRVLSAHHNRIQPKTVEVLMYARDWLWSETRDSIASKDQKFDNDSDIEEAESCTNNNTDYSME
ncbi:uncharacterized protein [Primulina eburnea]|uniref:uncharacterized protein n=1 Tax=Primulina eburnea TaxID=1245227 RepID=UPI003C6C173C